MCYRTVKAAWSINAYFDVSVLFCSSLVGRSEYTAAVVLQMADKCVRWGLGVKERFPWRRCLVFVLPEASLLLVDVYRGIPIKMASAPLMSSYTRQKNARVTVYGRRCSLQYGPLLETTVQAHEGLLVASNCKAFALALHVSLPPCSAKICNSRSDRPAVPLFFFQLSLHLFHSKMYAKNSFADEHRALSFIYIIREGDEMTQFKHAGSDTLELYDNATIKRASTNPTTDALISLPVSIGGTYLSLALGLGSGRYAQVSCFVACTPLTKISRRAVAVDEKRG